MESQEFEKILQLALFVIDDEAETKSKADIQLGVDQVTEVFKRLQDAKVQAVEKFLEDEKTLINVKAWSGDWKNETSNGIQTANRVETRVSDQWGESNSKTETHRHRNRSTMKDLCGAVRSIAESSSWTTSC